MIDTMNEQLLTCERQLPPFPLVPTSARSTDGVCGGLAVSSSALSRLAAGDTRRSPNSTDLSPLRPQLPTVRHHRARTARQRQRDIERAEAELTKAASNGAQKGHRGGPHRPSALYPRRAKLVHAHHITPWSDWPGPIDRPNSDGVARRGRPGTEPREHRTGHPCKPSADRSRRLLPLLGNVGTSRCGTAVWLGRRGARHRNGPSLRGA